MMAMMYTVGMLIQAIVEGQLDQAMGVEGPMKKRPPLVGRAFVAPGEFESPFPA